MATRPNMRTLQIQNTIDRLVAERDKLRVALADAHAEIALLRESLDEAETPMIDRLRQRVAKLEAIYGRS